MDFAKRFMVEVAIMLIWLSSDRNEVNSSFVNSPIEGHKIDPNSENAVLHYRIWKE